MSGGEPQPASTEVGSVDVLRSFLDEEALLVSGRVDAVERGLNRQPPGRGDVVVGVTETRLCWFDDELEQVDRADIEDVTTERLEYTPAPTHVRFAGAVLMTTLLVSAALWFLVETAFTTAIAPAVAGLALLAVSLLVARVRPDPDPEFVLHWLRVSAADQTVNVWGEKEPIEALRDELAA